MTLRRWFVSVVAIVGGPAPALAQTIDVARLDIGFSVGITDGGDLWDVPEQMMQSLFEPDPSIYRLQREVRAGHPIMIQATWFAGRHVGITGEIGPIGLSSLTHCTLVHDDGDATLARTCALLDNTVGLSSAAIDAGVTWRPAVGTAVQPFCRVLAGFAAMPTSTVETHDVYPDYSWKSARLLFAVAVGATTPPSHGLQPRIEIRETWVVVPIVAGATPAQHTVPVTRTTAKGLPSVLLGLDLALRLRRGRRY